MSHPTPSLSPSLSDHQRTLPFALIFLLLLSIYWGSFHGDWQMDDRPNTIDNPGLRIDNLRPETLWGTFFANQGKDPVLFRPLPCLTFALNWYAGKDNPFGYHLVNLGFHIAAAWTLYLLMLQLMMIHRNSCHGADFAAVQNIALLATILWAVNPIQTQAVTYIVQRMAVMAAFFYVLGMLFFINARAAKTLRPRFWYGFLCFTCFLGGLGSKENAVMLPASLVLLEWIFFQHGSLALLGRPRKLVLGSIFLAGTLLTVYFILGEHILSGYADRPFTMMERVMTEPRVLLMYLSQIFFPLPGRLSIVHDVTLFASVFYPWTTLPALALVISLIAGAIAAAKKFPLLSFALLFYFLNHVVESTILPLELVFEHRNYLPSFFLFLPVADLFHSVLLKARRRSRILHALTAGIMIVIIAGLGFLTHIRNKDWATWEGLWRDAAVKAPDSARPLVNLAILLAWRDNPTPANYRHALILFHHSLELSQNRTKERAEILGNVAAVFFKSGNTEKAVELYHKALDINPEFHKNRYDLIKTLLLAARFDEAESQARLLVSDRPDNTDYLNLLAVILMWREKDSEALPYLQAAMKQRPSDPGLLMNLGVAMTRAGYLERGHWFLRQVIQKAPDDPVPVLAAVENRVRAGDLDAAAAYVWKLGGFLPVPAIAKTFHMLHKNHRFAPISMELIQPVIAETLDCRIFQDQPGIE